MGTEEHVERQSGKVFDGEQQFAGGQMLAGLPMTPGAGGDAKLTATSEIFRFSLNLQCFSRMPRATRAE